MLYTYKYTENHIIEKLQQYIEFFFENMFHEDIVAFSDDLIHTDFKNIVKACDNLEDYLINVFDAYKQLDKMSQSLIIQGFRNNNLIEKLCVGEVEPIHYKDIPIPLRTHLDVLFKYLYKSVLNSNTFISQHCDMNSHFKASRELNKKYKFCPFCGLYPLNSKYSEKRDDYDHYLPKSKYPFNSVNFRNLVPICHECNTGYKKTKDPLFRDDDMAQRRKTFYPYDEFMDSMTFKLSVAEKGKIPIEDDQLIIDICSTLGKNQEVDAWNDIFEIKKRYIELIKDKIDCWIDDYLVEVYKKKKNDLEFDFKAAFDDYLNDLKELQPFIDQNFLRTVTFELLVSEYDFEKILKDTISA